MRVHEGRNKYTDLSLNARGLLVCRWYAAFVQVYVTACARLCIAMVAAQRDRLLAIYELDPSVEQRDALRKAYASVLRQGIPPEVLYSFLISGEPETTTWRLVVVWSSREAFESYCEANVLHPGLAIVRSAGCEARLSVYAP